MADNDLKREYEPGDSEEARAQLEKLRQKARLKREVWPQGPPLDEATDSWDDAAEIAARKEFLRKQAESLIRKGL